MNGYYLFNYISSLHKSYGEFKITYETVGGFPIKGTISKNLNGDTIYDFTFIWNDIIDSDYSDSKKAEFANSIPGATPTELRVVICGNGVDIKIAIQIKIYKVS